MIACPRCQSLDVKTYDEAKEAAMLLGFLTLAIAAFLFPPFLGAMSVPLAVMVLGDGALIGFGFIVIFFIVIVVTIKVLPRKTAPMRCGGCRHAFRVPKARLSAHAKLAAFHKRS